MRRRPNANHQRATAVDFNFKTDGAGRSVAWVCYMANVIFEWVGIGIEPPVYSDELSLCLEFPEWEDPLPRVGDSVAPPSGPMHVYGQPDGKTEWLVSSVTWEMTSDEESSWLEAIRIVVHETSM